LSRTCTAFITLCLAVLPVCQVHAQDAVPTATDQAIENARQIFGPPEPRKKTCGVPDSRGDIVVCAPDNEQYRVQSSRDIDPTSHEATYDGLPRAPQLDRGSCAGEAGCIGFGSVPPPVYYIDVTALPQAPAGSEADAIAKGEKPGR
jgi:hypothetical protein